MQATTNVNLKDSRYNRHRTHHSTKTNEAMNLPDELMDLMKDDEETKTYSGGILAILVICILLGLIAMVTYLTMPKTPKQSELVPVYFSDIFKIDSLRSQFEYEWKDEQLVFRNSSGSFYSIRTSRNHTNATLLLPGQYYIQGMSVSFDLSIWFIPTHHKQSQELEDEYSYKLLQMPLNIPYYRLINLGGDQLSYLTAIAWGPRSKYMVVVYKRHVYYSLNPLVTSSFICISCHLNHSKIYGQFKGYYKEKIFRNNKAFWWNKNGLYLAFLSFFDEADKKTNVEIFDNDIPYKKYRNISYTQAGYSPTLYKFEIHIFNLASQKLYSFDLEPFAPFHPYYIIHIQWYNSTFLLVGLLSADQTKVALLLCEVIKADCFSIFEKEFSDWINMVEYQNILIDNENEYIYIAITISDSITSQRNIGRIKVERGYKNMVTWLDLGLFNIIKLSFLNPASNFLFFLASSVNESQNHLYRFHTELMKTTCESCRFTSCYRNDVHFMDMHSAFLHRCSGPLPEVYQLILPIENEYKSLDLEKNIELRDTIRNKSVSKVEYDSMDIEENHQKYRITVKISHPRHLNPNHVIKYPVLVILLDSPRREVVNDDFSFGWIDYVTSYLQYVVIQLEVKGTRNHKTFLDSSRSWEFTNRNLNLARQTLRNLISRRLYMDNSSVGVIGENYGGYLSVKLMTGTNIFPDFRCGVAVGPIVDFASYDSFFAERYLGQYNLYKNQYRDSRLEASLELNKKELLLVHNVEQYDVLFENSAKFIKDLVDKNTLFDLLLLYGEKNNAIEWDKNKYALKKITKFFVNCFNRTSARYSILEDDFMHSS